VGTKNRKLTLSLFIALVISLVGLFIAFLFLRPGKISNSAEITERAEEGTPSQPVEVGPASTNAWYDLLDVIPIPYTTPLPETKWTPIDGTYTKLDPALPQWWACRRCADYRPAGGIWKLQFDKGVMRIYYPITGWRSIASYTVSGNELQIFNDPYCPQEVGKYRWNLEDEWNLPDRRLIIEVENDSCSINLRGENLSNQPWYSCLPPNEMTGASDHWHKPPGCEENPVPPKAASETNIDVDVIVHPGYTRDFAKQPDVYADANSEESPSPKGIQVIHSEESISYGLNRVLWGEGDWVQATTNLPFDSMGVQIYGDHTIGWARVLFDEEEVWRGNTAEIWSHLGRHGGYIEISGYELGWHTIRVESMGFDYHPVTVAYFGFTNQGGVEMGD